MRTTANLFAFAMILTASLSPGNETARDPSWTSDSDQASNRRSHDSASDIHALRESSVLGELPGQYDVAGDHLTPRQRRMFVSRLTRLMNENWESIGDTQKLDDCHAWLHRNLSCDPRLALARGVLMEKHHKLDEALYWYEQSRNCRPAIPYFGAHRRSILVRLKRKQSGDINAALNESVELVKGLVELAARYRHEVGDIDDLLAYNVHFVGRVLGYLEQPSGRKGRRFLANVQADERAIRAHLSRLPSRYDYLALFSVGRGDLRDEYLAKKAFEDQIEAENKQEAMEMNKREKQGEVESRWTFGPHVQAPNAIDYYEESCPCATGWQRRLPVGRSLLTRDKKWNDEWFKVIEPWYRRPPRRSEYVTSYFPMNLESERRKLFETFPDRYDRQQWEFRTH